jgi:hypothetical protein
MIDGFEKFSVTQDIKEKRDKLLNILDTIAKDRQAAAVMKSAKIKELIRRYTWKEKYENLKKLARKTQAGEVLTEDEVLEIDFLFSEESNNLRRQIFINPDIFIPEKDELLCELMEQNIFVLSKGAIESYYPSNVIGGDKPTKAMNAIKIAERMEDARDFLPTITFKGNKVCELDLIFQKIFKE